MKRPAARWLIRSSPRFGRRAVRWFLFIVALVALGNFSNLAVAQITPPDRDSARSISGQFIINRPAQPSPPVLRPPAGIPTNFVRLEPALLAVSAERIRELLWHNLDIKGQWRGQIYLLLRPARTGDENVTVTAQHFTSGWNYRVELPDVLAPTRFARALTGVLLLEFANHNAADRSAEIPAWLTDGLSQQLLAAGSPEFLLSAPDKLVNGLPVTRLEKLQHGLDPLAGARQVLKNHPALTFEELSWPAGAQLDGDDEGVYHASAQLFVSEVLKLKNGPAHLRAMLESLPQYYNWQVAFRSAFREDFPSPLDLEKWWALRVVDFAAHDPGPGWTLAVSREKLDEILRVPVQVRAASNSLPVYTQISPASRHPQSGPGPPKRHPADQAARSRSRPTPGRPALRRLDGGIPADHRQLSGPAAGRRGRSVVGGALVSFARQSQRGQHAEKTGRARCAAAHH